MKQELRSPDVDACYRDQRRDPIRGVDAGRELRAHDRHVLVPRLLVEDQLETLHADLFDRRVGDVEREPLAEPFRIEVDVESHR